MSVDREVSSARKSGQKRVRKTQNISRARPARENSDLYTSKGPMSIKSVFPRRQVVTMEMDVAAFYNTSTAQVTGIFAVNAASVYLPFSNVTNKIGVTGAGTSNLTLNGSYSITGSSGSPVGYFELAALYSYYKVRRAELMIKLLPQSTDAIQVALEPNQAQLGAFTIQGIGAQPYSVTDTFTGSSRPRWLTCRMSSPTALGFSSTQFEGLTPTLTGNAPSGPQQWFFNVTWSNVVGANPTNYVSWLIKLRQEVEFSELITLT